MDTPGFKSKLNNLTQDNTAQPKINAAKAAGLNKHGTTAHSSNSDLQYNNQAQHAYQKRTSSQVPHTGAGAQGNAGSGSQTRA